MRLRIVSDLHFEFQADHGDSMVAEVLYDPSFDVLVLAGDITNQRGIYEALALFARRTKKPILYVLGNHEAYGSRLEHAHAEAARARHDFPHIIVLEGDDLLLEGQRFVGCTLWYPHPTWTPEDGQFGDFKWIEGIDDWLHDRAMKSAQFLRDEVKKGDVVITHYLPHPKCIHPKWRHAKTTNSFFLHNMGEVVEKRGAKLWIHGHTHSSRDIKVGKTRVVCNPFGYIRGMQGEPNPDFDGAFTVEV